MELTKIEIQKYKSIKSPVTISFSKGLPTILIGKNGSGKTNILEALSAIASANENFGRGWRKDCPVYRAYIQLSEEDVKRILPELVYDKDKCEIVAYSEGDDLKIDRVSSPYIVSAIKKEIEDMREQVSQFKDAVDLYKKQIEKIFHDGYEESPIGCCELRDAKGSLTNYSSIHFFAEQFIGEAEKEIECLLKITNDEMVLRYSNDMYPWVDFGWSSHGSFKLEYVEPSLANFEQKFVSINKTAIKREITKINKKTQSACQQIENFIKSIKEREKRLQETMYERDRYLEKKDERYYSFIRSVRDIIGRRCQFLKSENYDVIFKQDDPVWYYRNDPTHLIIETYLRQVYTGEDRERLLADPKKVTLSNQAILDLEAFLNKNIPSFDREMYESISVRVATNGAFIIFLNEKTGDQIDLNETSAGRRWYFTYYFMKNMLSEGDVFIIDEPAASLHPSAQRDIFLELVELAERGVKVVYSTHSPYLIPKEKQGVHFVTMTEKGTTVSEVSSKQELISQMAEVVGEDIFDVQKVLEKYFTASPETIARNISELIRDVKKERGIPNLQIACDEIGIEYAAMKRWNSFPTKKGKKNKKFNSPSKENIIKVLQWAKKV